MIFSIAYAQNPGVDVAVSFLARFTEVILYPLILLMMGIAFLFFIYGCFEYIINADNDAARATGRQHILYSIIGLFVMLSAMGILRIAVGTFGLQNELECANNPNAPGCNEMFRVPNPTPSPTGPGPTPTPTPTRPTPSPTPSPTGPGPTPSATPFGPQ